MKGQISNMKKQNTADRPPDHLSAESSSWWLATATKFVLEQHHIRLLTLAAEAWDRGEQTRQALAAHGNLTFVDSKQMVRARPEVAIERDARIGFARLIRELDLDAEPPAQRLRPPGIISNKQSQIDA